MATRTVKARVELDGEKEYKQAISELNKGNAVLSSEMKKLQAEYQGNTESMEFLTEKGDLLNRQLLQQKEKVATLREALANAAAQYGESSEKTQSWQIQLNNAEAAQYDLEHAIRENNDAINGENQAMVGLGDTVSDLAQKLGIRLPDSAKEALNGMTSLSSGTVAAMGVAVAGVAALVEGVKKLNEITLQAAADADELMTEAMTTGLSTETIQKFQYAENLIDVSYQTISGSLTKLTANMDKARDGNEELASAFAQLGVEVTDVATGELRPAEDVFYDMIDTLGQVDNATERDALTMQIFGKSAQDLNPLIIQGSDALRELGEEAEKTGYVLDESQIAKLGEVDDAYQKMQLSLDATKKELALQFAPASKSAMELFSNLVSKAGDALERSGMIENLATILGSLMDMFGSVADLIGQIPLFQMALDALRVSLKLVAQVLDTISRGVQTVVKLFQLDFSGISDVWSGYGASWTTGWGRNATGNDNWRGGMTYVGEAGPEAMLLPSGTQILSAQDTRLRGAGGVTNWYVTIDAKNVREFTDIVNLAQSARLVGRMA